MSYRTGANFERALARRLKEAGAYVVRSAGSKGPADLVAWHKERRALIQAKVNGGTSRLELERLITAAKHMAATAWVVSKRARGQESWQLIYPAGLRGLVADWDSFKAWLMNEAALPWK